MLELLPVLRAELARTEEAALAAAHRTGVPAEAIAQALRNAAEEVGPEGSR